tara:strand:+ start:162 stop:611 length:450 start_codon:yes stop_codon:yes gene_type:complete
MFLIEDTIENEMGDVIRNPSHKETRKMLDQHDAVLGLALRDSQQTFLISPANGRSYHSYIQTLIQDLNIDPRLAQSGIEVFMADQHGGGIVAWDGDVEYKDGMAIGTHSEMYGDMNISQFAERHSGIKRAIYGLSESDVKKLVGYILSR